MTWGVATSILWLAADAPAADSGNGPVVVIISAITVAIGTIATAFGPALLELIKNRGKAAPVSTPPAAPPTSPSAPSVPSPGPPTMPQNALTQAVQPGIDALSMVDAAVRDVRTQRDAALLKVDQMQATLDAARSTIGQQLVEITQLRARLARYEPPEYPDPYGRQQPMHPPQPPNGQDPYGRDGWSS